MNRDKDVWRWLMWGTLVSITWLLYRIATAIEHLAAAAY